MSIPVTVRRTNGTTTTVTTSAYASAYRPEPGDYVRLTVDGATAYYTVRWAAFSVDVAGAPKVDIGAALPQDPPPPPPT